LTIATLGAEALGMATLGAATLGMATLGAVIREVVDLAVLAL
jgi:hypothetical protein